MSAATLSAEAPATTPAAPAFRALVRWEVRRLARHPLFVIGTLLFVVATVSLWLTEYPDAGYSMEDGSESSLDWPVLPSFFLGLGGLLAMNRLTRSSTRLGEVLGAVPVPEPRRTAALCVACLLPAAVALVGTAAELTMWVVDPPVNGISWTDYTRGEHVAILASGVLCALGGPLLGVLVARWWPFPLAAAIVAVLLIVWSVASLNVRDDDHRFETAYHHASPFTLVAQTQVDQTWLFGGSLAWRLVYLAGLCSLAALGAIAHGTEGAERRRIGRWLAVVAVITVLALAVTALAGPDGALGRWDPRWT